MGFGVISSGRSRNGGKYDNITQYFMPGRSVFTIYNLLPYSIYNFEIYTKTLTGASPKSQISSIVTEESGKLYVLKHYLECKVNAGSEICMVYIYYSD